MTKILTPDMVILELQRLIGESAKAPAAIYDAECKLADCEFEYDRVYNLSLLNSEGAVAVREAIAKLDAADARLAADLAKAELNRIRNKTKQLTDAGMLTATMAKQVELTYKHGN
jgi:hypothetical protein